MTRNMISPDGVQQTARLGLTCICLACATAWSLHAAEVACPLRHGHWEPFPALTDEFDGGKLDESKWLPNNPSWLGRQPGYFNSNNVRIADGMLHLDAKKESLPGLPAGYHDYTTAFAGWFGLPTEDALPATFSIDYIRTWKRKDGPADDRPETVEFSFPGRTGAGATVCRLKAEEGGTLVLQANGGAERPERVHLDYMDDAFFGSQKEPEIQKTPTVRGGEGQGLSFFITWSKTEAWKREGRERSDEVPGAQSPPTNGYHAVGVDVRPLAAKPRGTVEVWEFPTENGTPIQVTVRH